MSFSLSSFLIDYSLNIQGNYNYYGSYSGVAKPWVIFIYERSVDQVVKISEVLVQHVSGHIVYVYSCQQRAFCVFYEFTLTKGYKVYTIEV